MVCSCDKKLSQFSHNFEKNGAYLNYENQTKTSATSDSIKQVTPHEERSTFLMLSRQNDKFLKMLCIVKYNNT